jgi:hypothetical protein
MVIVPVNQRDMYLRVFEGFGSSKTSKPPTNDQNTRRAFIHLKGHCAMRWTSSIRLWLDSLLPLRRDQDIREHTDTDGNAVRLPAGLFQSMAAEDVASVVAKSGHGIAIELNP